MQKALLAAGLGLILAGCSTYQAVTPVEGLARDATTASTLQPADNTLLCVISSAAARNAYLPEFRDALRARGFDVRMLPPNAPVESCPLTVVYFATRQTYWNTFLDSADITVYSDGTRNGKAVFNANRSAGGVNLSNLLAPAAKLDDLVGQLFPDSPRLVAPDPAAAPAPAAAQPS